MTRAQNAEASQLATDLGSFRARLAAQDLSALSDEQRLQLLFELDLLTRASAGVAVRTQVAFHSSQVAAQVAAGVAPSRAGRAVPDDLARVRRTSPYWGTRDDEPTSDTNGQGLCQRCNNAREHPRINAPEPEHYRLPPSLLPAFLADRSPPFAA
jgi:hypothetical protein